MNVAGIARTSSAKDSKTVKGNAREMNVRLIRMMSVQSSSVDH